MQWQYSIWDVRGPLDVVCLPDFFDEVDMLATAISQWLDKLDAEPKGTVTNGHGC